MLEHIIPHVGSIAGGVGITAGVAVVALRLRRIKRIVKEGYALYNATSDLVEYVRRAEKDGWTPDEGAQAGRLAVAVKEDLMAFINDVKAFV